MCKSKMGPLPNSSPKEKWAPERFMCLATLSDDSIRRHLYRCLLFISIQKRHVSPKEAKHLTPFDIPDNIHDVYAL